MRGRAAVALFLAVLVTLAFAADAIAAPRNAAQEAEIDHAVEAISVDLVKTLHDGNDAMDRADFGAATQAYAEVHERAPTVAAVTRRLGTAEARSGLTRQGIKHCRQALEAVPSPENHAALAAALLQEQPLGAGEIDEAFQEARIAVDLAPNAEYSQTTLCSAALERRDDGVLDNCSKKLIEIAPDAASGHTFRSALLAMRDDIDGATTELEAAHARGLDGLTYTSMHARLEALHPKYVTLKRVVPWIPVGWFGITFLLFVLGMLFGDAPSRSRGRRAILRAVLGASALWFYMSAAFWAVTALGTATAIVLTFLVMSNATLPFQIIVGIAALYMLAVGGRSLFARAPERDLGEPLDLADEPKLREVLGARIDSVFVQPGATFELVELGGAFGHLRRKNRRALVIGVGAVDGLTVRAFEALVAFEVARFGLANATLGGIEALVHRMEARGAVTTSNPAWWFVSAFRAFFERISEGALELQDELAEESATTMFEAPDHAHLAEREANIEQHVAALVIAKEKLPENLYASLPCTDEIDGDPAWSLFSDREALEIQMTDRLRNAARRELGA